MEQEEVWNKIAPEWHDFKTEPSKYVSEFLKNKKGKILDLGSGSGRNLINLKTEAEIYLVDFSSEMLKLAKRRTKENKVKAKFYKSDVSNLSFENNFFDAAIFTAVLHCISDREKREKAIKELFRVLKPNSEAEIEVWNRDSDFFKNAPKEKYIRWTDKGLRYYYLYDKKEVIDLFKKSGFEIVKIFNPNKNIVFIVKKS